MNNSWIYLSLIGCVMTALMVVILNYLSKTKHDNNICLCMTYFLVGLFGLIYLIYFKSQTISTLSSFKIEVIYILIFLALLIFLKTAVIQSALVNTPTMSYAHLIINLNIILTILAGYYLFNEKINPRTIIGMVIAVFGIYLVIYYSNE